jgi:hypothetical protein
VPVLLDSYASAGEAWVCLEFNGMKDRVVVQAPSSTVPQITLNQDTPPEPIPGPKPGPAGNPSSDCLNTTSGTRRQLLNQDIGPSHVWLYEAEPTAGTAVLCVRTDGAGNAGGKLVVDGSGVPGPSATYQVADDSNCATALVDLTSPQRLYLGVTTARTASACVDVGGIKKRVSIATAGSVTPPRVQWSPDPGTPVPAASAP